MNDNITGRELLRSLQVQDLPPSTVDLDRALRSGRRRERARYAATATLLAVAVLVTTVVVRQGFGRPVSLPARPGPSVAVSVPIAPKAPPLGKCTLTKSPPLNGNGNGNTVVDPTGRVVVSGEGPAGEGTTFLRWIDNGQPQRITGAPVGGASVNAVNSSGDFVGTSGYKPAWVYRNGRINVLPLPDEAKSVSISGINERGDIAGWVDLAPRGAADSGYRPIVWPAGAPGTYRLLEVPSPWIARSNGIGEDGTVVGTLTSPQQHGSEPYIWHPDGTGQPLEKLSAQDQVDIRSIAGDWVVGKGTRWNVRTGSVDRVDGLDGRYIDRHGRVFGTNPGPGQGEPKPAVWVNGTVQMLPVYPETPLGMIRTVTADGTRITATLQSSNGMNPSPTPVIWTCA
jgi:hypothetical protein